MNIFKKMYCRTYQFFMRLALPILPYRQPIILKDNQEVAGVLADNNKHNVFLVTDEKIRQLGLVDSLQGVLEKQNFNVTIFDKVLANPTVSMVENGRQVYLQNNCDCIVALGGGSVIDCAKAVGARIVKPKQSVNQMRGLLKVNKKLPLLVAIPTTAGTGSETTLAAVITDDKTHHKYAINDFSLIPHYALLDYHLTLGLNPYITCTTGMDALTHAIEAYIGKSTTRQTRKASLEAIKLISENLVECYKNGSNALARQNMLEASYLAGVAFTKSYVGYVHAIAHSLGGEYGVAHGLANAVILPVVLRNYGKSVHKKLAYLARLLDIATETETDAVASGKFIEWVENLNRTFNLPTTIKELKEEDIGKLARTADQEANPLYPVPKLMDDKQLSKIYYELLNK